MRARPRTTHRTAALIGAAALLLSACGSTVQVSGTAVPDQGLGGQPGAVSGTTGGGTDGGATGAALGAGSTGSSGPGTTGTSAGGIGGTTGTGGTTGVGGSSGSTPAESGSAVTGPLKIGVALVDYSAIAASFGVAAGTTDPFAAWKHIISALNKRGGFGGRKIVADYYKIDGAASDAASAMQAACTHFAQDVKAQIVMTVGVNDAQGFSQCLLKYGITQFDSGQYVEDATQLAKTPNQFTNGALGHDRMAATLLKVAVARGWITKKDKLGVVYQQCPVDTRVYQRQILPAMKAAGIPVVGFATNCLRGNADIGAAASQMQSAVLRFQAEGVTQVTMPGAPEGAAILLFSQGANQQRYYPGYLLTSNSFAYDNSQGNWPAAQLTKMRGIGFSPLLDVGLKAPTTPRQAQAQAACKKLDPTAGDAAASSQPTTTFTFFYAVCDTFQLLGTMLRGSNGQVSVSTFARLYPDAAGNTASAKLYDGTFATQGGRRDGAGTAVPFSYKSSGCKCMSFDGAPVSTQ